MKQTGADEQGANVYLHPDGKAASGWKRTLAPVELAALQNFPAGALEGALGKEFQDARIPPGRAPRAGLCESHEAYRALQKVVGNAVDGAVARSLGGAVLRSLIAVQEQLRRPEVTMPPEEEKEEGAAAMDSDDDDFA